MNLSVKERLVLNSILPAQGDITTLKIVRKLREDLSFSEEEHKKLKFVEVEGGGLKWNWDLIVDIEIGEKAMDVIKKALEDANNKKQLNLDHLDIYERFVEKEESE